MKVIPKVIRLSSCLLSLLCQVFIAEGQTLQSISVAEPVQQPLGGGGDSGLSILSPDGRYVLFASTANNLDAVSSQLFPIIPPRINVFLRDRTTSATTLVSVNINGTGVGMVIRCRSTFQPMADTLFSKAAGVIWLRVTPITHRMCSCAICKRARPFW